MHSDGRVLEKDDSSEAGFRLDEVAIPLEELVRLDKSGQIVWLSTERRLQALPPAPDTGRPENLSIDITPESTKVVDRRVLAVIFDIVLINVVQVPLGLPLGFVAVVLGIQESEIDDFVKLAGLVIGGLYFVVCEANWGRTPGKYIMDLKVVSASGGPVSAGQALGRNAARMVDMIFFGLPAFVAISGSKLNQRWGDQWSKTYVIRHKPK